jgi:hypothetical protein
LAASVPTAAILCLDGDPSVPAAVPTDLDGRALVVEVIPPTSGAAGGSPDDGAIAAPAAVLELA